MMPTEVKSIKFQMMVAPSEMAALDEYRWKHRLPSRAETIRTLVQQGISENEKGATEAATSSRHNHANLGDHND